MPGWYGDLPFLGIYESADWLRGRVKSGQRTNRLISMDMADILLHVLHIGTRSQVAMTSEAGSMTARYARRRSHTRPEPTQPHSMASPQAIFVG